MRYRFTVVVRNALGTGPASAPTHPIAPASALFPALWCSPAPMAIAQAQTQGASSAAAIAQAQTRGPSSAAAIGLK